MSLVIRGPVARADLPALTALAHAWAVTHPATPLRCDVSTARPDVVLVDALARMARVLRAAGSSLDITGIGEELRDLIGFMGLTHALRARGVSPGAAATRRAGRASRSQERT